MTRRVVALICEDVGGPNRRCIPIEPRRPECDPRCDENQQPSNYVAGLEWQEFMAETHEQRQCPGCGLWTIWEPKPDPLTDDNPGEGTPR